MLPLNPIGSGRGGIRTNDLWAVRLRKLGLIRRDCSTKVVYSLGKSSILSAIMFRFISEVPLSMVAPRDLSML